MEVARAIPTDIGIITIIRLSTALVAVIHPLAAHAVAVAAEASAVVVVSAVVAAEAAAVWVEEDNTD